MTAPNTSPDRYNPVENAPWPAERYYRDAPLWSLSGVVGVGAGSYDAGALGVSFDVAGSVITVVMRPGRARVGGLLYERVATAWRSGTPGTAPTPGSAAYPLLTGSGFRRDRLVIRRDLATGTAYPLVLLGASAASAAATFAVAPTRSETGIFDLPVASWVLAGNSSTTITDIRDERLWASPDGAPGLIVANRNRRYESGVVPAHVPVMEYDTAQVFRHDNAEWTYAGQHGSFSNSDALPALAPAAIFRESNGPLANNVEVPVGGMTAIRGDGTVINQVSSGVFQFPERGLYGLYASMYADGPYAGRQFSYLRFSGAASQMLFGGDFLLGDGQRNQGYGGAGVLHQSGAISGVYAERGDSVQMRVYQYNAYDVTLSCAYQLAVWKMPLP